MMRTGMKWSFLDGDDRGNDEMDEDASNVDQSSVRDPERSRNKEDKIQEKDDTHVSDVPNGVQNNLALQTKIQSMANQILDKAFDNIVKECCEKVLAENEDDLEPVAEDGWSEDELCMEQKYPLSTANCSSQVPEIKSHKPLPDIITSPVPANDEQATAIERALDGVTLASYTANVA